MKKKLFAAAAAIMLLAVPAFAVFNEKDLSQTISVLRFELKQQYDKLSSSEERVAGRSRSQHREMVRMMKKCNELSLMLYSQGQDYTFDVTYALGEVTKEYEEFNKRRMPYDDMLATLSIEIDRYERLLESLRRLPPSLDEIEEVPDSIVKIVGGPSSRRTGRRSVGNRPRGERPQMDSVQLARWKEERRAFVLDEQGQEDRDSCIFYALSMLRMYKDQRQQVTADQEHYNQMNERLRGSYEYAEKKYSQIQKRIFVEGQDNYFKVLGSFSDYSKRAFQDAKEKYKPASNGPRPPKPFAKKAEKKEFRGGALEAPGRGMSEWRGPVVIGFIFFVLFFFVVATLLANLVIFILSHSVASLKTEEFRQRRPCITALASALVFAISVMIATGSLKQNFFSEASGLLLVFAWLLIAILTSLLVRLSPDKIKGGMKLYAPVIILGLIVITFRIIFIPNKLVNLIYPPMLLFFAGWQLAVCLRQRGKVTKSDETYAWITFCVILASVGLSWAGYVLLAVQVFIWWLFQLTAISTITALYDILGIYEKKVMAPRLKRYSKRVKTAGAAKDGGFIEATWAFDLFRMALLPVSSILSVLLCIHLAADVFDLEEACHMIFYTPFLDLQDTAGNAILHLSLFKLMLVSALFFVFRYANYALKSFYKHGKFQSVMKESGKQHVHANEINLTLANNLIGILIWGTYIVIAIALLKIPMGALSVVAAGLATGIGLALKDVLNNFIYGIQLMSGRLRVGDYIECDGVRGKVDGISYQTTQICTPDGAVMSFTNSTLFNKNFKNLTRNNAYELVTIPVGVAYGSNVAQVRSILLEALESLKKKDAYGREIVDPKRGFTIAFSDFGDSSVDLLVKQYVLVEERVPFMAQARELIYDTLNSNGVEIPFPQRDLYIKSMPSLKE